MFQGSGFRAHGSGLMFQGSCFRVQFRVQGSGLRVQGSCITCCVEVMYWSGVRGQGSGFRGQGPGDRLQGLVVLTCGVGG